MTQIERASRTVINGSGWANPLSHSFYLENSSHLKVYAVTDVDTDEKELLSLGSDYSLNGIGDDNGYDVTIATPGDWADVERWVLSVEPPIDQPADISIGGSFGAPYEAALDRIANRLQHVHDLALRAIKSPLSTDPDELDQDDLVVDPLLVQNLEETIELATAQAAVATTQAAAAAAAAAAAQSSENDAGAAKTAAELARDAAIAAAAGVSLPVLVADTIMVTNPAGTARINKSVADFRDFIDVSPYVATRAALKAIDTTKETVVYLTEVGREGIFIWRAGNFTAHHAADTAEGVYVKATAIASAAGSWVRFYTGDVEASWFGVLADDSTNNATALTVAIAVADMLNTGVQLPAGVTRVGSAISLPTNMTLEGRGRFISILKTTSATANILITTGVGVTIKGIGFASSVTRSAGAFVEIAHGLFELSDFYMTAPFIGILLATAQRSVKVFNGEIIDAVPTTGISIDVLSQGVDYGMHDLTLTISAAARPGAHIRLRQLGDMSLSNIQIYGAVNNMTIEPATGQGISSLKAVNCWFDQAGGQGLLVQPSGTGFFKRSSFIGCWFGGNGQDGGGGSGVNMFPVGASTSIDGIDFNGCEFPNNATAGIFTGGTAGVISNIDVNGCRIPGNVSYGVLFDGVLGGAIRNCKIGPAGGYGGANGTGVHLASAAANIMVNNNDLRGNTAALVNAASGAVSIEDNLGYVNEAKGVVTGTTDGSGDLTITHGMSVTPTVVIAHRALAVTVGEAQVHSITSTNFKVRFFTSAGVAEASVSRSVMWAAYGPGALL